MTKEDLKKFLHKKPSYLKKGKGYLSRMFDLSELECSQAQKEVRKEIKKLYFDKKIETKKVEKNKKVIYKNLPKPFLVGDPNNILIIGDLHEPFCLDGYLEFCRKIQEQENCGKILFIGDVIDNHYSSYHETDPDGFSAGEELDRAINKIATWYEVFPLADVVIGNHDRMVYRRAHTAGVSERWIRKYNEVLETPNWTFKEDFEFFEIDFNHGEGGTARTKMRNELQSQVQGHLHSQFYIEYAVGKRGMIFGMQVGCGVDREAYAMAYGKKFKKPAIGCGVIKNGIPQLFPMKL